MTRVRVRGGGARGEEGKAMSARRYRLDRDGHRHLVSVVDGVEGFWTTLTMECSGCFEWGEYGGMAHLYPYDNKANCHVGNGCEECGYTGKRRRSWWQPFDQDEARP